MEQILEERSGLTLNIRHPKDLLGKDLVQTCESIKMFKQCCNEMSDESRESSSQKAQP